MTTTSISTKAATAAAAASTTSPEMAKFKKTAQQFEAVFIRQMIGSMRSASPGDGIFDSEATKQFQDMSDAKTADVMAAKGALGIADMLVKQYGARIAPGAAATAVPGTAAAPAATAGKAAK
jgi:flagellar protein FlgJ